MILIRKNYVPTRQPLLPYKLSIVEINTCGIKLNSVPFYLQNSGYDSEYCAKWGEVIVIIFVD